MRLLDTRTKELADIADGGEFWKGHSYAILSHCWRDGEVQFQDMVGPNVKQMKGYAKLSAACDMAYRLGVKYLWMDTCCIDKSSSSELSEAINSMHKWYRAALLCIVYLDDVRWERWQSELIRSRWFKRGWTLQELIAPRTLVFVDKHWRMIKTKESMVTQLATITGIDKDVLLTGNTEGISIATKMAWAAERETTRPEDMAYALMGIFDVNMPTIYGEGGKAFIRLQEEIIKKSNDQSIFAWGTEVDDQQRVEKGTIEPEAYTGLLASHPKEFRGMNDVVQMPLRDAPHAPADFTLTNRGIRIQLPIQVLDRERDTYLAFLACRRPGRCVTLAILLQRISEHQYTRFSNWPGISNLIEIEQLKEDAISWDKYIYVDEHKVPQHRLWTVQESMRSGMKWVDLTQLHALERWNLTVDYRYRRGSNSHVLLDCDDGAEVIVKNQVKVEVFMLSITRDIEGRFGVRVIALGPCDERDQRSSDQIYSSWGSGQEQRVPLNSSPCSVAKLQDGQEIEFVLIPTTNNDVHFLLVAPRISPGAGVFTGRTESI